jgi:hypothetical protein
MYSKAEVQEYLDEIREQVCTRCVDRPPGGPPCAPLGKMCAVELFLPSLLRAVHEVDSPNMNPYVDNLRRHVCSECVHQNAEGFCLLRTERTCALDYLFPLIVQAVETVDERHAQAAMHTGA